MNEKEIVGIKNVTYNESFFPGHFPENPVMPGVLQIEAMAQVGGVMILSGIEDPENYITYFMKIENAKFKDRVVPGDTMIIRMEIVGAMGGVLGSDGANPTSSSISSRDGVVDAVCTFVFRTSMFSRVSR